MTESEPISRRWGRVVSIAVMLGWTISCASQKQKTLADPVELSRLGVQVGFHVTTEHIQTRLKKSSTTLDRAFDFSVYLKDGALPPVVELFDQQTVLERAGTRRERFKVSYRISTPARMVIEPPTWRDYLIWEADAPELQKKRLPRDDAGMEPYQEGVEIGHRQALEVFRERLDRMRMDLRGMRVSRLLEAQGVLKEPQLATKGQTITVSPEVLAFGVQTDEIVEPARFQDPSLWRDPEIRLAPTETARDQ